MSDGRLASGFRAGEARSLPDESPRPGGRALPEMTGA